MKSRGKLILFADADGASKFSDLEKLENAIKKSSENFEVKFTKRFIFENASLLK
jgi:hypothetical protein